MTDGWTSGTAWAWACPARKRLVNEFEIDIGVGQGHARDDHPVEVMRTRRPQRAHRRSRTPARSARRAAPRRGSRGGAGFDDATRGEVAIVATELANNLVRHARGGRCCCAGCAMPTRRRGGAAVGRPRPGHGRRRSAACATAIPPAGTPGNGLGAVRRLSARVRRLLARPAGTVIARRGCAAVGAGAGRQRRSSGRHRVVPCAPREDGLRRRLAHASDATRLAMLVADGLGHGPLAAEARTPRGRASSTPTPFAAPSAVHRARPSRADAARRGAAVALRAHRPATGAIALRGRRQHRRARWSAASRPQPDHRRTAPSASQIRKVQDVRLRLAAGARCSSCTPTASQPLGLDEYPGCCARHPAVVAGVLCRDFMPRPRRRDRRGRAARTRAHDADRLDDRTASSQRAQIASRRAEHARRSRR